MMFDLEKNQDVDPQYFDALALYYVRYLQEYQKQGIFVDFLSLFNEPLVYTKMPYSKIRDLLKHHVGPLFHRLHLRTTIQVSDHMNRAGALKQLPVILDDPQALRYVGAISFHGYDFARAPMRPEVKLGYSNEEFNAVAELRKRYRRLPLWMTEICKWDGGTPWAKPIPRYEFEDGDFWGQQIFSDIEAGVSGWTYWNMILDENGGPWLVAPVHGNPDHNVQHPVVIINRQTKEVTYTGLYYYLAHFSRFVRPYSTHVKTAGTVADVRCVSFKHDDGRMVSQLMNSGESDRVVTVGWNRKQIELNLPAISITTLVWSNRE
jgi:glucosylceramidase